MAIRLYNTLTRRKEPLEPLVPGEVRTYVCGATVYDLAHVGHARSAIVFDVIRRYLTFAGYRVTFVKNFTDVDDKIIARAAQLGQSPEELAEQYIAAYREDMDWLGVAPPDVEPQATKHVSQMIGLIERLLAKAFAYEVDGDVYFEVRRFPSYGRLSGRAIDELLAGARVEVDERKRDPLDFALWKRSKPGEPSWKSPWGPGRPGWHIECSAMSMEYLGESLDIHGGGQDLIFPHHENELAQSEAATQRPFVQHWIHNGFVNFNAEKMSKSRGNILNIRDLRQGTTAHPGGFQREAVRLYLLGTHYRSPLEFWEARIDEANRALARVRGVVGRAFRVAGEAGVPGEDLTWAQLRLSFVEDLGAKLGGDELLAPVITCQREFVEAMDDDFNTPQALAALFELSRTLNVYAESDLDGDRLLRFRYGAAVLLALSRVLGLLWWQANPYEFTAQNLQEFAPLVEAREGARKRHDWRRADAIRAELEARGVVIEDTPSGPRLKWKRTPRGA